MLNSLFEQFDSIIFLDVETSGLNHKSDEIIELGAIRVCCDKGELYTEKEINMLVRLSEGKSLREEITKLTGITQTDLDLFGVEKTVICEALQDLFVQGRPLVVAYNAQFDLCFLYYLIAKYGNAYTMKNIKMLDALTVYIRIVGITRINWKMQLQSTHWKRKVLIGPLTMQLQRIHCCAQWKKKKMTLIAT